MRRPRTQRVPCSSSRGFGLGNLASAMQVPTGCMSPLPSLEPLHSSSHGQAGAITPRKYQTLRSRHRPLSPSRLQGCSAGCPSTLSQLLTTRPLHRGNQTLHIWLRSSSICQVSAGSTKNGLFGFLLHPSSIPCVSIPR